jgi:hypothetical protein
VHFSKEALDLVAFATASPEVDMVPKLVPESRPGFHQRLHSVKLVILQKLQMSHHATGINWGKIDQHTQTKLPLELKELHVLGVWSGIIRAESVLGSFDQEGVSHSASNAMRVS